MIEDRNTTTRGHIPGYEPTRDVFAPHRPRFWPLVLGGILIGVAVGCLLIWM